MKPKSSPPITSLYLSLSWWERNEIRGKLAQVANPHAVQSQFRNLTLSFALLLPTWWVWVEAKEASTAFYDTLQTYKTRPNLAKHPPQQPLLKKSQTCQPVAVRQGQGNALTSVTTVYKLHTEFPAYFLNLTW